MYFDLEIEFERLREEVMSSIKEKMMDIIKEKVRDGDYTFRQAADLEEMIDNRSVFDNGWRSSSANC